MLDKLAIIGLVSMTEALPTICIYRCTGQKAEEKANVNC